MVISQHQESNLLYVQDKGRVRGPFLRSFIDAMILSGHFSINIKVSLDGKSNWTQIESAPQLPSDGSNEPSSSEAHAIEGKTWKIVLAIIAAIGLPILLIFAAINSANNQSSNSSSTSKAPAYPTPSQVVTSTPQPVSTPIIPITKNTNNVAASTAKIVDKGWSRTYQDGLSDAHKSGKNLLLYFSGSDWSIWSKMQKSELFDKNEFKDYASTNLVLVQVDFANGTPADSISNALQKYYQIDSFPTLVLLSPEGNIIKRHTGLLQNGYAGFQSWLASPSPSESTSYISPIADWLLNITQTPTPSPSGTPVPIRQALPVDGSDGIQVRPAQPANSSFSSAPQSSYTDSRGATFSYPKSQGYTLKGLETEVNSRKQLVDSYKQSMNYLNQQINRDRQYLDHTDQNAVDQFNQKVDRYNVLKDKYNAAVADMNLAVDQFNAELERIGTRVKN